MFTDRTGDLHIEARFQEPGTGNSQNARNVILLHGSRDSNLRCSCQPLLEARRLLIQWETSSSAQCLKFQVRGPWKALFLCNPSTDIASWEQYCQWGRKQWECLWHDWVPSWAQLFTGAFPIKVGPQSHCGRALPLSLPACQWVEQSLLWER